MREEIAIGDQVFVADGGEVFGAVRRVAPYGRPELVIYVENAGDFVVPLEAVEAVHSQKVIVNCRNWSRACARLSATLTTRRKRVPNPSENPYYSRC